MRYLGILALEAILDNKIASSLLDRILAKIAAGAGAQVTIFQHGERMLKQFDPDLVGWLMDKFHELGIDVRTESDVDRSRENARRLIADGPHGETAVDADLVVRVASQAPDFSALDLDAGQVRHDNGRSAE